MVIPALIVGLGGVGVIWRGKRGEQQEVDAVQAGHDKLEESLAGIVANHRDGRAEDGHGPLRSAALIDARFMDDLDTFVENRGSASPIVSDSRRMPT